MSTPVDAVEKRLAGVEAQLRRRWTIFPAALLLAALVAVLGYGFLLLMRRSVPEPRPLTAAEARLTVEQLNAAGRIVEQGLRDEVSDYRAIATYLKIALPVVSGILLILFWTVVRSHVDERIATAEIRIREKTADDMRKIAEDRLREQTELVRAAKTLAEQTRSRFESELEYLRIRVEGNLAFVLWAAGNSSQAAKYAEIALSRIDRIPATSEHHRDVSDLRLEYATDAAYYHADHYSKGNKAERRPAIAAAKYLQTLLKRLSDDESSSREINEALVDAIFFVASNVGAPIIDPETRERCQNVYKRYREAVADYLGTAVPARASELCALYQSRLSGIIAPPVETG